MRTTIRRFLKSDYVVVGALAVLAAAISPYEIYIL